MKLFIILLTCSSMAFANCEGLKYCEKALTESQKAQDTLIEQCDMYRRERDAALKAFKEVDYEFTVTQRVGLVLLGVVLGAGVTIVGTKR